MIILPYDQNPFRLFVPTLAAAALFGLSAPLSKILLGEISGVMLASLLYLGSGIGLLFVMGAIRSRISVGKEVGIERKDLLWLAGAIFAGGVAAPIALLSGLGSTPASVASLMMNFEGVATALIASIFFKEAIGRRSWAAVLLIFRGKHNTHLPARTMDRLIGGPEHFISMRLLGDRQ
jgi:drug/metabolite transporter (DMT)-like permease